MYQTTITEKEAGQRFDKYLRRILPEAGNSFLYKMLRKKNITLNGKRADGSEKIAAGDSVAVYFSKETLARFMGSGTIGDSPHIKQHKAECETDYLAAYRALPKVQILYENEHILLADKPAGVLSQKAEKTDISLNEWLIGYLLQSGAASDAGLAFYKPSVCNRLDRNTSGIVLCAKSLKGAQLFGELLKNRTLHKYYQLYVRGTVRDEELVEGYLIKNERLNKVSVEPVGAREPMEMQGSVERQGCEETGKAAGEPASGRTRASYIKTRYKPLRIEQDKTLLEVELITGKSHQIRAHLASVGHPLLGDYKYGDRAWNDRYRKKCHVTSQLLHAYKVVFPLLGEPFTDLSGRTFCAKLPDIFEQVSERDEAMNRM